MKVACSFEVQPLYIQMSPCVKVYLANITSGIPLIWDGKVLHLKLPTLIEYSATVLEWNDKYKLTTNLTL